MHNAARSKAGLARLRLDDRLTAAAQHGADVMKKTGVLTHSGWTVRIAASGYKSRASAENIAEGQKTPEDVMVSWLASVGHRRNILGNYRDVGFGVAGVWWCADFASPG